MQKQSFSEMECPIAQALEQIGEWWSLLILRDAMLGVRFFGEFEKRLGITPTTLTRRLQTLVEHGVLARRACDERPPRDEYVLTEKGRQLFGIVVLLGGWGNTWIAGPGQEHLQFVDNETGAPVDPVVVDRKTGARIDITSVRLAAGPKARRRLLNRSSRGL